MQKLPKEESKKPQVQPKQKKVESKKPQAPPRQFQELKAPKEESKLEKRLPSNKPEVVKEIILKPEDSQVYHGSLGNPAWRAPKVTYKSDEIARKGESYKSKSKTEYKDHPEVLIEKVKLLAQMIRDSQLCVAYTGAGISTGAGIPDYASAKKPTLKLQSYRAAKPTKAHHVLAAMINNGNIMHWLQQNHDGLAQKAGCPKDQLNEIHGSNWDKSNPVVKMGGQLKTSNHESMQDWIQLQDMCIAVGSAMVGMNSDNVAVEAIKKHRESNGELCRGLVIINNQETQYHIESQLNIFNDISETFMLLAKELGIKMPANPKVYDFKDWK